MADKADRAVLLHFLYAGTKADEKAPAVSCAENDGRLTVAFAADGRHYVVTFEPGFGGGLKGKVRITLEDGRALEGRNLAGEIIEDL